MKIRLYLKAPDCVDTSIHHAVVAEIDRKYRNRPDEEKANLIKSMKDDVYKQISKWVSDREQVTIEINTTARTAKVLTVSE